MERTRRLAALLSLLPLFAAAAGCAAERAQDEMIRTETVADGLEHPWGMTFHTAGLFEDWQGDVLVGSLTENAVVRLQQDGRSAREVQRINMGARVRDVVQGPEGAIYVLTDEAPGKLLRLTPEAEAAQ